MRDNSLATKNDLKKAVSKLATKVELAKLDKKLDRTERSIRMSTRMDFEDFRQEINEKINLLPTKDEFFASMDKIMGELQTIREEQTISGHQLSNHEDRIIVLENVTSASC